jgi:hypothetical protein
MREQGLPKVLAWRWAPFAALVAGSLSFCAFALLVIPDHIGSKSSEGAPSLGLGLANTFVRNDQTTTPSGSNPFASESTSSVSAALPANPTSRVIARSGEFPKRGFTPPLERAEPPTPVAVPPPAPPPPAPPPQAAPPPPEPPAAPPAPPPQAEAPAQQAEPPAMVVPPPPVGAEAPN